MTEHDFQDGEENKSLQLDTVLGEDGPDPEMISEDEYDDAWANACTVEEAKAFLDDLAAGAK